MGNIPTIWELVAWCWGSPAEEREKNRMGKNKPDFTVNWKKKLVLDWKNTGKFPFFWLFHLK